MKINRKNFYDKLRPQTGKLTKLQVQGFEAIFDEWEKYEGIYIDIRWLSYMLATAWHETNKKMQAIEEYGRGKGRRYGRKVKHSGVAYTIPDDVFFGRGLVQLTWYENYQLMGRLLGIPLLQHPELALKLDVAIKIMFEGMLRGASSFGDFTGKCLEQYFNDKVDDPISARRIINGTDKAELIAQHHELFLNCFKK